MLCLPPCRLRPALAGVAAILARPILFPAPARLHGPCTAWLAVPAMADRLQRAGEQIRFHSSLPAKLNELAILITGRHWTSQFEWYAHYPLALKAGLEPAVAADLAAGAYPAGMSDDEEEV